MISVEKAVDEDGIIIIASLKYANEMYKQLIGMGVADEHIIVPVLGYPEIQCGWQYFDLFEPLESEVFIDAGTYDGGTIVDLNVDGMVCGGGSRVTENGKEKIEGRTIDSILEDNKSPVTFIKMDVEGSELKSLEGAANAIIKYRHRLAISVYHKPNDILEIADYILSLNKDYKLFLRHYTGNINETVLYAAM